MLSYKQYKSLNESVMPSFTLGLANPSNLGIAASPFGNFAEAKKNAKKKMFGDEEEMEDEGDGEMVPAAAEKDEPEVDLGDEEEGCDMCSKSKKNSKKSKKKMWSDEDEAPEEEAPEEEAPEDECGGGEEEEVPAEEEAPMFSKKSKKKCGSGEMAHSKKSQKKLKKETTEEEAWWNSVKSMMGPDPDKKYGDGWTEYQDGFTPVDTENLTQAIRPEPEAGDFGFAPQKQMGSFFG